MTEYTEFAEALRRLRAEHDSVRLSATLHQANARGWPMPDLAGMLGISRQAVHRRVSTATPVPMAQLPPIPKPPPGVKSTATPRPAVGKAKPQLFIKAETARTLRAKWAKARTVNGATPLNDPARKASVELSKTMAQLLEQGASRRQLSRILGITQSAVSLRLARHGYQSAPGYVRAHAAYKATTTQTTRRLRKEQKAQEEDAHHQTVRSRNRAARRTPTD